MQIPDTASATEASRPLPLGLSSPVASRDSTDDSSRDRVNVAVFAPGVNHLEIVFQAPGEGWKVRALTGFREGVHHSVVDGITPGTRYGFRAAREDDALPVSVPAPEVEDDGGQQLLLDPYGRGVDVRGDFITSVHMDSHFDWGDDRRPDIPWRNTIIYEAHVRGQTMLHPDIPEELRGTYAGMAHPAMIEHLTGLGITSVQLLPVHFHLDEPHLQNLGFTNYWGYNSAAFFAPHPGYATESARNAGPHAVQDEFKGMVKLLHQAGIEVILDVVYNHTAEGGPDLPPLSFRGLAERHYYRHDALGRYLDTTGCGNSLNFAEPRVWQLVVDSLRYWIEDFHIDGFRFDLAVTLCRNAANEFDPEHPFLKAVAADPVVSKAKRIAEPWDVGHGGWQTGRFPEGWVDWNDHFRDGARRFWLTDRAAIDAGHRGGSAGELADIISGSAGLFERSGRSRMASVNLVTAHDGFTLADLTSYDRKHNEANGEQNRDGHSDNLSYNHGFEGRSEDESIVAARTQTRRNLMATLMISIGIPMITAGDELGRTQQGNNNAYCQDNPISWVDWSRTAESHAMLRSTKRVIRLRKEFLSQQPHDFPIRREGAYLHWFDEFGAPMSIDHWNDPGHRVIQLLLGAAESGLEGLVVINGGAEDVKFKLPKVSKDKGTGNRMFELRLTTSDLHDIRQGVRVASGERDILQAYSINIYRT